MNKIRIIALFCTFLMLMLPICIADEFEESGENLIIEVKKQEPEVLRSDYMEQLNIPVRIILGAIRGAPISVPEIKDVDVDIIKKKEAQEENASVTGTSEDVLDNYVKGTPKFYHAPYPTLDNLGYVQITLKQIEEEHKVPKTIDIDFKATIKYEADLPTFVIGGEQTKILKQATRETVEEERQKHSILEGNYYLRVESIGTESAKLEILDNNFEHKTSVSLDEGEISRSIKISEDAEPESIRLKLEEVRGAGVVSLKFEGEDKAKTFDEDEEVAGNWKLDKYFVGDKREETDDYIILKSEDFKSKVIFTNENSYDTIADLKKAFEECSGTGTTCPVYKNSKIKTLQKYTVLKDDFQGALKSLELLKLESFKGIEAEKAGTLARIEVGGFEHTFNVDSKIGDCGCKVQSISKEYIWIKDIRECDPNARSDTQRLETGQSEGICGTVLELKGITSDQEAVITVLPGTGKGKTTTYFSVHIPVEERLIQYTPEELQKKIESTQKTIESLDKTIKDLETLVEGWTKVCLAVMAVFTITAFLEGMSGTGDKEKTTTDEQKIGTGEPKEGVTLKFPPGVNTLTLRDIREEKKNQKLTLSSTETYTMREGLVFDKTGDVIALSSFVFTDENGKKSYILANDGTFKEADKYYGSHDPGDGSGAKDISVSSDSNTVIVPLQSCGQLPSSKLTRECESHRRNLGTSSTALYLVYNEQTDYIDLTWGGKDGKLPSSKSGESDGDYVVLSIDGRSAEGKSIKTDMLKIRDSYKRGELNYKWKGQDYNLGKTHMSAKKEGVECGQVMDPGKCKILFNACDPVMCPSSRCDFNDRYRVPNVIQSGLLGSLLLCLPNIKDGVILPVCLSGILAALKNIRSILQGYVNCLQSALDDDKSVGICDTIRSIFICKIIWKEAMTLLGLARGNIFDALANRGGGEYLTGLSGGVENAKKSIDFFTKDYATSVFAAYQGRSSEEIGAQICEKAIYGKGPILGDIVEDVTKAQNPPQFTAYIEEDQLYSETGPESGYKLYYHIYAGAESVNYKVYLKKSSKTYTCSECSGTLEPEGFVDKSTIFVLEQGYDTICVEINGKHNCNFGRVVSSSFGMNQVNDYWLQYELSRNIKTEAQCRADTRGTTPHAQVERVCHVTNPGLGSGKSAEEEWQKVGTCGKNEQGVDLGDCWIRLGNLEDTNPQAYRETTENICQEQGKTVCKTEEVCIGIPKVVSVREYQDVLCCDGECREDTTYQEMEDVLRGEAFVSSGLYSEMYARGIERCKDEAFGSQDPFESASQEWYAFETQMERAKKSSEEYNQFHYFKGMLYLLCKNCADAAEEFNQLDKGHIYYLESCEDNKIGAGGVMFERCKETCSGQKITTPGEEKEGEKKVEQLQLTKLILETPSEGTKEIKISGETKEIELETGGTYKVKGMQFNKKVKSCSFSLSSDIDVKTAEADSTICKFTTNNDLSTVGIEDKTLQLLGVNKEEDEDVYSDTFTLKLLEKSVISGKTILCITTGGNYFCIYTVGERCSDYHLKGDLTKQARSVTNEILDKSLEGCKAEYCPSTPEVDRSKECLPSYHSYEK